MALGKEKSIDLQAFLTEAHTLIDMMVVEDNEYLLFAVLHVNGEVRMEVWRCRLHGG